MSGIYSKLAVLVVGIFMVLLSGCVSPPGGTTSPDPDLTQSQAIPIQTAEPLEITFEVTFDENHNCIISGPAKVQTGDYLISLTDQSELKIDLAVTHLIDGHTYEDLLNLQNAPGEPFIKVYWMSHPRYFTIDHKVWTYSLDEAGQHVILILKHTFEGIWICDPFQVVDPALELTSRDLQIQWKQSLVSSDQIGRLIADSLLLLNTEH